MIRENDRSDIEIIDFKQQHFDEIKDKNDLIEEEVVNNIINDVRIEYPRDDQNLSFPNTSSEILKETNENNKIDQAAFDAFNERDDEISQELITTARNDLIKSITDEDGEIPTEALNNITSSYELQQETTPEKNVRDHIQNTIKKNNEQYLEKIEKEPLSEVLVPPAPPSSPVRLTELLTDETGAIRRSKRDQNSDFYSADKINSTLLNKGRRSSYEKDKVFYKLFNRIEDRNIIYEDDENRIPFYTPFVEQKKDIDRSSSLYTINGPLQFFHADVAFLKFFAKSAVDPKYALLCVDLFTSKIYVYTMRKKSNLWQKLELFYKEIDSKRDKMRFTRVK